ncbi:unnamed protein product [Didymodactylos carnosus]|uniref:Colicin E3-like ribonuclease domain-containing protein n=1 Tax=Didymodactylos carnosus TaxID=1234261 RepID=A0A814HLM7_9BILA|nr:unnamed protein product [Didymodactylos carnosus]CAF1012522.1 unnamed protein product [Didymodactylos carnosus]CAF3692838.1 unnamed protein product [Didymodactylos carnosus]CAF3783839.1 unnamed protein product [Didymodactylos carnosus]
MQPSESAVWTKLKPWRGAVKRDDAGDLYQWDYTHGDIEVYNSRGEHKGCIDPTTGAKTKPPVKGRKITV